MKFEAINEKEFLNPYHRKKPILETELNEFIKTLKDYKINLENNLKNNEDSLVANALSKFFENLSFQCEVKSIHKGNSGIDLALKKMALPKSSLKQNCLILENFLAQANLIARLCMSAFYTVFAKEKR